MYLSMTTRPDINFVVSFLARFMHCYSQDHFKAAKEVLWYLSGTRNTGLVYSGQGGIVGFTDADSNGEYHSRKPTSGCVFTTSGTAFLDIKIAGRHSSFDSQS